MKKLISFEHFRFLKESENRLNSLLDRVYETSINENLGAALGSPFKFLKIKKAAKEYQSALVQKSINNLDFEKKKAAGTLDTKQKDVLAAANKQKNQALTDKASAISQKIDSLATTGGLKTVASIAKNKSQMAAAELAAKTADGEEAKALKLRIQGLNKKIKDSQEELEDYKDSAEDDQNLDNVKTADGETIKDKKDREEKEKAEADKKKEEEAKEKAIKAAQAKLDAAKEAKTKLPDDATDEQKNKADNNIKAAEDALAKAKGEEPKAEEPKADDKKEEPKAEEPKAEEPKADDKKEEPKAEEPKAEEPKAEEPKTDDKKEEPKAEEPKAEEPKAEEPKAEEPKAEEPKSDDKKEEPKADDKKEEPKAEDKKEEDDKITDSITYVGESIADRFRYLMNNKIK